METLALALIIAVIGGLFAMLVIGIIRAIDNKFFKDKIINYLANIFNENEK